jgi:cell wall-associated NlpC family hydrolase
VELRLRRYAVKALSAVAVAFVVFASSSAGAASSPVDGAIAWAENHLGQAYDVGLCLTFVYDAYSNGGGVDIGTSSSAVGWWNAHASEQHAGDLDPPRGALVFWGATPSNADGHVGISLGGGNVISTYSYPATTTDPNAVHEFSIASRNAGGYPYLGWIAPPGVALVGVVLCC